MSEDFPILKYAELLEEVQRRFENLPTAYQCPFCLYVSETPLTHTREKILVYWFTDEDDREHNAVHTIEFCRCPRCNTEPPRAMEAHEFFRKRFKQYTLRMPTPEYIGFVNHVKEILADELKEIHLRSDEPVYRGWPFEDLVSLQPEVAWLVRTALLRLIKQSGLVKETAGA
jgi:hypothetical protein